MEGRAWKEGRGASMPSLGAPLLQHLDVLRNLEGTHSIVNFYGDFIT